MNIEYIHDDDSAEGSEGLLAICIPYKESYYINETRFLTDNKQSLQVGILRNKYERYVKPHIHYNRQRTTDRTQEILFIRIGSATVTIYNSSGKKIKDVILKEKDCILFIAGGHSVKIDPFTEIVEVKNGPYKDRSSDKIDCPHWES